MSCPGEQMSGGKVFIGVDVGSASVRAGLYDDAGRRLAFAVRPIRQFHPRTDFVEQSSADIWRETCAAVREAVALAGVPADCHRGPRFRRHLLAGRRRR